MYSPFSVPCHEDPPSYPPLPVGAVRRAVQRGPVRLSDQGADQAVPLHGEVPRTGHLVRERQGRSTQGGPAERGEDETGHMVSQGTSPHYCNNSIVVQGVHKGVRVYKPRLY